MTDDIEDQPDTNAERNDLAVLTSEEIEFLEELLDLITGVDARGAIVDRIEELRHAIVGDPDNRPDPEAEPDEGFSPTDENAA